MHAVLALDGLDGQKLAVSASRPAMELIATSMPMMESSVTRFSTTKTMMKCEESFAVLGLLGRSPLFIKCSRGSAGPSRA